MTQRTHSLPIKGGRFLIVGGASLVGSASAELFLREGAAEVTILDSFFQGSADNIKHLAGDKRLKIVQGDVMRLPQLIEAAKGMDGVLHLAALMTITMDRDPWTGPRRQHSRHAERDRGLLHRRREEAGVHLVERRLRLRARPEGRPGRDHALPHLRRAAGGHHLRRHQDHRRAALPQTPSPSAGSTTWWCAIPPSTASVSTTAPPTRSTSSRRTTACARACARA